MELRNKNIGITGGAGFVGSAIARMLSQENRVRIIDVARPPEAQPGYCACDITHLEEALDAVDGLDIVFHQAGFTGARPMKSPDEYFRTNVEGTLNVLKACVDKKVKKFIFASTYFVYDLAQKGPLSEEAAIKPSSYYAAGKLLCEHFIHTFNIKYRLPVVSLRYFRVYGPGTRDVVTAFSKKIMAGEDIGINGDGTQAFDYVHVDDVAYANILAAQSDVQDAALNVGSGSQLSLNELTQVIMKVAGRKVNVSHLAAEFPDRERTCADLARARALINYKPQLSIGRGVKTVLESLSK